MMRDYSDASEDGCLRYGCITENVERSNRLVKIGATEIGNGSELIREVVNFLKESHRP